MIILSLLSFVLTQDVITTKQYTFEINSNIENINILELINKLIVRKGGQWLSSGLENRRPTGVAGSTPVPSALESWQSGNAADC